MICPRCSNQVAVSLKPCGTCGTLLQPNSAPPPSGKLTGLKRTPLPEKAHTPALPEQYEEYADSTLGNSVPKAKLHNPKGSIRIADMTITIDGELVPVVDIMLGNKIPIYFEHHILLWKHPGVQLGFKSLNGAARRFFSGLQILMTEAQGPGNISFSHDSVGQIVALRLQQGQSVEVREHQFLIASGNIDYNFILLQNAANILFSRTGLFISQFTARGSEGILLLHGYGNVFEKMLAPGEILDVEPGAWLWKDPSVQMQVTTVAGSQRRRGILGTVGGFMAGTSITFNRFVGPGRIGIQSMAYHPPAVKGAPHIGGQSNFNFNPKTPTKSLFAGSHTA